MNVGYFAFSEEWDAPNAGFVHTINIAEALADLGINIKLFIRGEKGICSKKINIVPVELPRVGSLFTYNPLNYWNNYRALKGETSDLDIIHERFHVNPIDLLFVGQKKYILEVNDPGIETWAGLRHFLYAPLVKLKFERCDAVLTQTETLKKIIQRHLDKPIYVVPNGVDAKKFSPLIKSDVRQRFGIGNDILITFVGSFREWHGVLDIPKIARTIPRRDVKFLLVGSGPLFQRIKIECKGDERIILAGPQPYHEIPKFLAASDILIAPFDLSGFEQMKKYGFWWSPVKLYEYMASGKAIVASDFAEVKKIVKNCGLLAQPGNVADFVEKLYALINSEELRASLGFNARHLAEMEYCWDKRANEILSIYDKLQ